MGTSITRPLNQGGAFGDTTGDTSYFSYGFSFTPFSAIGKHELDCYAEATSTEFDPSPITTATVTAPFIGAWCLFLTDVHMRICRRGSYRS